MTFLPSSILPPLATLSRTEEMCFLSLVVSLGASRVMGVAPWFSLPGLARDVRSKNVSAASVVSSQPLKEKSELLLLNLRNGGVAFFGDGSYFDWSQGG